MSPPVADSTKDVDKVEKKQAQRRINKPLIEKRRRARINECLAQLKAMVLEANDDTKSPRSSKLEKADILEMTVEFIQKRLTKSTNPLTTSSTYKDSDSKTPMDDYVAGYSKCIQEISQFLERTHSVNETIKHDVVSHISQRLRGGKHAGDLGNDCSAKTYDKLPIIPIKKRKLKTITNNAPEPKPEVNDSLTDDETGSAINPNDQIQPLNLSKTSDSHEQATHINYQKLSTSQTPVGFLCGSQIMLLVQVPSSMTPQQFLTQSVTSLPQQQIQSNCSPEKERIQTNSSIIFPKQSDVNSNACKPERIDEVPVGTKSEVSEHNLSASDHGTRIENQTDHLPAQSVIVPGNHDCGAVSGSGSHWRPW